MKKMTVTETATIAPPQKKAPASEEGKALALAIAKVAADTRCTNVIVLDVSHVSPVTDFFVIATGTSARQMRSVCDDCIDEARTVGYKPMSATGYDGSNWICVDLIDVVLHVFTDEARAFYDLENLWSDAQRVVGQTPAI